MILYYNIQNYKSFRDKVEFNMIASSEGQDTNKTDHIVNVFGVPTLRLSAIYGNNGAGKSTLLESIQKLRMIVVGVLKVKSKDDLKHFKLDPIFADRPTVFEIEYIAKSKRYCYHLSILNCVIVEEWICIVNDDNSVEYLFTREFKDGKIIISMPKYDNDLKERMRIELYSEELQKRPYTPFLRFGLSQYEELKDPFDWFANTLQVVRPNAHCLDEVKFFTDSHMHDLAVEMISFLKLDIEDIQVKTVPLGDLMIGSNPETFEKIKNELDNNEGTVIMRRGDTEYTLYKDDNGEYLAGRIVTIHKNGIEFELDEESMGTRMIFELIPGFVGSIINNKVYLFDEIECNKHPEVTKELILMFLIAGTKSHGQLIFTTHECNLLDLDILRTDEIWFTEKDGDGVSHIYSLSDFKPTYDKDIKKGYLEGRFTSIPFFTDPKQLNWYGDTEINKD